MSAAPDPLNSAPAPWPDLAGRIDGPRHVLPIRVYYEDTDFSGLAYHASYLRWCERGRSDWLRLLGMHHNKLLAAPDPAAFVVRKLCIDYLKPARIDEVLEVVSRCAGLTSATLTLGQQVLRAGVLLAEVEVLVVLVNAAGRPLRLPAVVRGAFGGEG